MVRTAARVPGGKVPGGPGRRKGLAMTGTAEQQDRTRAGEDAFDRYMAQMDDAPLLGHVVFYSVFDGAVTPETLARWFAELELNPALLPPPLRADGAYEAVTSNVTLSYTVPARRGADEERTATLFIRKVRRDRAAIVCHLVRELRDSGARKLDYTPAVAEIAFVRDRSDGAEPGAGTLEIIPHLDAVPQRERERVEEVLGMIREEFSRRCHYLTGDRIRVMLHAYIERLHALKVRPTGGVYFVHRHHHGTLRALRSLLERFGAGSNMYFVPLPDKAELRDMVIKAFRAKAREDLQKLSADLADAQQAAASRGGMIPAKTLETLYRRYQELQAEAGEHSELLSTDLDETGTALALAGTQIAALLTQAA